jgi:hypothetical protein
MSTPVRRAPVIKDKTRNTKRKRGIGGIRVCASSLYLILPFYSLYDSLGYNLIFVSMNCHSVFRPSDMCLTYNTFHNLCTNSMYDISYIFIFDTSNVNIVFSRMIQFIVYIQTLFYFYMSGISPLLV